MPAIDNQDKGKSFQVRFLLSHPNMHPNVITATLALPPYGSQNAGEPRFRPNGERLPGVYSETQWCAEWSVVDSRLFFQACMKIFREKIEPHSEFLKNFVQTGGRAILTVDAKGSVNVGDVLSAEHMLSLAAAGIAVGLEIFPGE